jgi:hypothetical protein
MPLPSGLPERVAYEEPLARFLTSSGLRIEIGKGLAAALTGPVVVGLG